MRTLRCLSLCVATALAALPPPTVAQTPGAAAATSPLRIDVGRSSDFSRLEFRWQGQPARLRHAIRDGVLVLRFDRPATPDLARLHVDPPPFVTGVESATVNGGLELRLRLAPNTDYTVGQADGATYVNLFARRDPPAVAAEATSSVPLNRPNPAPASGIVPVGFAVQGADAVLSFRWNAPAGAAVFRRGSALWIVFDANARLDAAGIPRGLRQITQVQALNGADWSALRLTVPNDVTATPSADGPVWTVRVGPAFAAAPQAVNVGRAEAGGPPAVQAALGGVTAVRWIDDPVVRDRLAVATAMGPARGVSEARNFVDFEVLPSRHGVAVAPVAGDLIVRAAGDFVMITRPNGLAVSTVADSSPRQGGGDPALPQAAPMPAIVLADWGRTGAGGFLARQAQLQRLAAQEGQQGQGAGVAGRLALARFLAGSGLNHEAIGVLNALVRRNQGVLASAEVRGLRGALRAIVGRAEEAQADFASPILTDDPSSALWRGWIAAKHSDWVTARQQFEAGRPALTMIPGVWRARFLRSAAEAALASGDRLAAWNLVGEALRLPDPEEQLETRLLQARILNEDGQRDVARSIYEAVATAPVDRLAAPALLHATELQLAAGAIQPQAAVQTYDGLRFRWRGDGTEIEVIRALGRLYLDQGRFREALEALRSAGARLPNLSASVELQRDLSSAFRALFLDGWADRMQPIQALALFYDFRDLTPIGADGDQMVRRLSDRLVAVDLLDQAAELLAYQVNNRLDGVAKAQVATDLATLYLMNRRAQDALVAINSSRTTVLPNELNLRRRVVEARALTQLGRYDHALEVLADTTTPEAQDLRAEIAWSRHDWPQASQRLEALLGERWRQPGPLNAGEEQRLLRAAAGYTLANDQPALARLRERWSGFVAGASAPDALRVAMAGASDGNNAGEFGRVVAEADAFTGWVARMRTELRARADAPAPAQNAATPAATPPPAQAAAAPARAQQG